MYGGTEIPKNSDMNSYNKFGNYYCPTNSAALTLKNAPFTEAFTMTVEAAAGIPDKYQGQIYRRLGDGAIAYRYYSNDGSRWLDYVYFVGKSSLTNVLQSEIRMETGEISMKIERGKHTTRHSQVIPLSKNTYLMDTPGFSSMYMPGFEKEDLKECYPEFVALEEQCRFTGCSHIHEPDCAVKEALSEGKISTERYENYCTLYEEIKDTKKY